MYTGVVVDFSVDEIEGVEEVMLSLYKGKQLCQNLSCYIMKIVKSSLHQHNWIKEFLLKDRGNRGPLE